MYDRIKSYKRARNWFLLFLIEGLSILFSGLILLFVFNLEKGAFCVFAIIPLALAISEYNLMKVIKEGIN